MFGECGVVTASVIQKDAAKGGGSSGTALVEFEAEVRKRAVFGLC
jgi:hypothetical protein